MVGDGGAAAEGAPEGVPKGVFDGKVVLVTGGSRGLGREMCDAFAAGGATVVVASRKLDNCEAVAAELRDTHGIDAVAAEVNVSDWSSCDRLVDFCIERFGGVDVLINNAGMSPLYPSLEDVSEALFDKVIGVNLRGPFRLTARLGPRMVERGGGSIVNISSIEAARPTPNALPYAAAKLGLEALTVGFAKEFGPTVRVNTIRCGMFATDISKAWGDPDAVAEMARRTIPLERVGSPDEIVGAAVFLASPASSYATGSVLALDGGMSL